jgi:hypothetical protein
MPEKVIDKLKLRDNEVVWVEPRTMSIVEYMNEQHEVGKLYTSEEVEKLTHDSYLAGALANAKGQDMGDYWKWKKKNL